MRVVGSGKVADVSGAHAFVPKPGEGAVALGVRVTPCPASCGALVADTVAGAAAPVLGRRQRTSEVGAEVGKAKPVRKGAGGPCQGACEGAELVRVRYERHSLLFDRSWQEPTPPPLSPSELARTR
jgi:hypothetical protein